MRALGFELGAAALDRLEVYAGLLEVWAARMNLISCRDAAELVERHLLDSLVLVPMLRPGKRIVDLGSGAGFPGIALAVTGLFGEVVLVESRRRRASFLRAVKRELDLAGLDVLEQRAELGPPEGREAFDAAVCRAVWSDAAIIPIAAAWLAADGRLFWMRQGGAARGAEPATAGRKSIIDYRIGHGPSRQVHVFAKR